MSDLVVLVHGLGRTNRSMWRAAAMARRSGYAVLNWSYPSRTRRIDAHADALAESLAATLAARPLAEGARLHFLTHSLGGIIVRAMVARHDTVPVGRVVMIAPPNQGSEVADMLRDFAPFRWITGVPGQELGTGAGSTPNTLPPVRFELGVIAGTRATNPLFTRWLGAPNDGKVSVARARVTGMRELLEVRCGHTWLPWHRAALSAAFAFLATGRFPRRPGEGAGAGWIP